MNNLHVTMTPFRYESRVLKETASLVASGLVGHAYVAALHEKGLPEHEAVDDRREVWRLRLRSRGWPRVFFFQLFKYVEYCARVYLRARRLGIGIVNVHAVDLLPLGVFLKRVLKARLVYDPHELETEKHGLRGVQRAAARRIERMFIRRADLVVVVGEGIGRWYRDAYGLDSVVSVMNCPERRVPLRTSLLHEELRIPEGKKIVLYQGGLARGRGVEFLLDAFSERDDGTHVMVFMGYGELERLVRERAALRGNIYFREAVRPEKVLAYTAAADVGVAYIEDDCLSYNMCLPNKLFEYVMAGLPVIVNDLPEMARVVREYNIGVVLRERTGAGLRSALHEIGSMDREVLAENLRRAASICSWEEQERIMIKAYKDRILP